MRKLLMGTMLLAAIAWGSSNVLMAQDAPPTGGDNQAAMGQGADPGPDGGGMMGGSRMDKLKEKLGLTDDQAAKIKDLFKGQMEANKPLRDQMKIDMDTLRQKVDMKASDGDIKKLLDKLDGEQKQMQESREKMKDRMRSILTPTQQAKMVLGMQKMGMMQHRKGHHDWKKGAKDAGSTGGGGNAQPAPNGDGNN